MKCELIYVSNSSDDSEQKQKPELVVVQGFSANDTLEASSFVKKYNEEHNDHTYYWRRAREKIGIWHEDGVVSYRDGLGYGFWDDADEFFISRIARVRKIFKSIMKDDTIPSSVKERDKVCFLRKIARIRWFWGKKSVRFLVGSIIWLKDELEYYLWDKWVNLINDISFNIRNVRNFKRTGHAISEHWGLSEHMLGDLKYNLKKLIEVKHGVSFQFIGETIEDEHKNEPGFDIDKWLETNNYNIPDDIHEKANVRCNELYQHIIDLIDKYAFYSMTGPEPEKEYPNMVIEGSYDELDYKKMREIGSACWDEIWSLVKKYGQSMWD